MNGDSRDVDDLGDALLMKRVSGILETDEPTHLGFLRELNHFGGTRSVKRY